MVSMTSDQKKTLQTLQRTKQNIYSPKTITTYYGTTWNGNLIFQVSLCTKHYSRPQLSI